MKFVSITSDEVKEAILEGNRISVKKQTYDEVRDAVDNPSDVDEFFTYDNDFEKMFFGYITICKEDKYVFLLMQTSFSSDTEKCLDNLIDLMTTLGVESKQKSSKIKTLESELESVSAEIDFIDEVDNNSKLVAPISCQVKLPSQKSYITIDNFDMFV